MAPSSSNAAGHTPVFITAAVRTPIAAFQGALAETPGPKLGAIAIKEAVLRAGRGVAEKVDEVIMGEVLTAGVGQAPARQAAIFAGLSSSVPCMTVNKVCGSGFTTAPVGAIRKACERAGLTPDHIDLFEINEAFAAVTMVAMKDMNIPHAKVNVHGGAVALGHPIGASGARILTTLVHALRLHNKRCGPATLSIGGGEAVAVIVERV